MNILRPYNYQASITGLGSKKTDDIMIFYKILANTKVNEPICKHSKSTKFILKSTTRRDSF